MESSWPAHLCFIFLVLWLITNFCISKCSNENLLCSGYCFSQITRLIFSNFHQFWCEVSDTFSLIFCLYQNSLEVHANAAETLCTIAQNAPSPLATKLSSSRFAECFHPLKYAETYLKIISVIFLSAVLLQGYLGMLSEIPSPNLALSTHFRCAFRC